MREKTIIIGIDPGKHGAICIINGKMITIFDAPIVFDGKKNRYDLQKIVEIFNQHIPEGPCVACIEEVHAMPKQGVTSMFEMGYGLGLWHMALAQKGIAVHRVRPQEWKKFFGLSGTNKDASRLRAIEQFPSMKNQLSRKKDDGRAEALLMASFISRILPK